MPERFPSKVRDPADNNDPHKIGRREPRAEYLGWLHCRQINEFVDHCAWMSSQADSRVAYPGRDSSVFSKLLHAKRGHSTFILRSSNPEPRMSLEGQERRIGAVGNISALPLRADVGTEVV